MLQSLRTRKPICQRRCSGGQPTSVRSVYVPVMRPAPERASEFGSTGFDVLLECGVCGGYRHTSGIALASELHNVGAGDRFHGCANNLRCHSCHRWRTLTATAVTRLSHSDWHGEVMRTRGQKIKLGCALCVYFDRVPKIGKCLSLCIYEAFGGRYGEDLGL